MPLIRHYLAVAPTHARADGISHMIEQVDIKITSEDKEIVIITVDSNTLSWSLPEIVIIMINLAH